MSERWTAARTFVRRVAALRLSTAVATELLPIADGEDPERPDPLHEHRRVEGADLHDCDFSTLAARYPELLATAQRKQRGTWYTPAPLAEPTVERTLAPLADRAPAADLRICDPAAGGGTFLVAALRWLVARGADPMRAAACLHGVDVDSTAAALAALAIHEVAETLCDRSMRLDPLAIAAQVCRGDGLLELPAGGFDAVLTNPPWETLQATKAVSDYVTTLRPRFRHQGRGKLYTYRLFVERAHQLLRDGGRFGLIVPASLWFDRDAADLRRLLLDDCGWEWLFGFENRRRLFAIDSRYRFAVVIGSRGGTTSTVRCAFGRTEPKDWAADRPRHVCYPRGRLTELSPRHATFVECEADEDLEILARMQHHGVALTGPAGAFAWRQGDFNMTSDRDRFVLRDRAERAGYRRQGDGVWRRGGDGSASVRDDGNATGNARGNGNGDDLPPELLPLYQGAMLFDLHPNTGAHRDGVGHKTRWQPPPTPDDLRPLYLVDGIAWRSSAAARCPARIALRTLSNATNARTAAACLLPDVPCGNSLGVLTPREPGAEPLARVAAGAAVLGSLAFDWALRRRLTGTNLNGFVLADCVIPQLDRTLTLELARLALQLCAVLPWHGPLWQMARVEGWSQTAAPCREPAARAGLLTAIDRLVGRAFGLDRDAVAHIAGDRSPRGFDRVDVALPPAARRPARWLAGA